MRWLGSGGTATVNPLKTLVTLKGNHSSNRIDNKTHRRGLLLESSGMAKSKVTSGMWRIDPQKLSRVVDRCGLPVASVEAEVEANANASLIAAAPDMFELLESLEVNASIPDDVIEEIKIVLRRARGDFGLAMFSRSAKRIFRARTQDWEKFMEGLWNSDQNPPDSNRDSKS